MARGWESKSVEMQIEATESRSAPGVGPSAAQVKLLRERENLALSRIRVLREIESSKNPRYLELLARELKALEASIVSLN